MNYENDIIKMIKNEYRVYVCTSFINRFNIKKKISEQSGVIQPKIKLLVQVRRHLIGQVSFQLYICHTRWKDILLKRLTLLGHMPHGWGLPQTIPVGFPKQINQSILNIYLVILERAVSDLNLRIHFLGHEKLISWSFQIFLFCDLRINKSSGKDVYSFF